MKLKLEQIKTYFDQIKQKISEPQFILIHIQQRIKDIETKCASQINQGLLPILNTQPLKLQLEQKQNVILNHKQFLKRLKNIKKQKQALASKRIKNHNLKIQNQKLQNQKSREIQKDKEKKKNANRIQTIQLNLIRIQQEKLLRQKLLGLSKSKQASQNKLIYRNSHSQTNLKNNHNSSETYSQTLIDKQKKKTQQTQFPSIYRNMSQKDRAKHQQLYDRLKKRMIYSEQVRQVPILISQQKMDQMTKLKLKTEKCEVKKDYWQQRLIGKLYLEEVRQTNEQKRLQKQLRKRLASLTDHQPQLTVIHDSKSNQATQKSKKDIENTHKQDSNDTDSDINYEFQQNKNTFVEDIYKKIQEAKNYQQTGFWN